MAQPPEKVVTVVADLTSYPRWLSIVRAVAGDANGWLVDLELALGPIKQTKRVRMERVLDGPETFRFERNERDGAEHPAWVLEARLAPEDRHTRLAMHLHYGGAPDLPVLDAVLAGEARRAATRLGEIVAEQAD